MVKKLWVAIKHEINEQILSEPTLAGYYSKRVLQHDSLESAVSELLSRKLASEEVLSSALKQLFDEALRTDESIVEAIANDLIATRERDPAVVYYSTAILYFKGFLALQAYRMSHWLWINKRQSVALYLQSRISEVFNVDIHPAAVIGSGILIDHATGIVIGETCVLEDNISIMQGVTLGGTGNEIGDRHPKVREGVLLSAAAQIIGNVNIGKGAKVGAGSVVLKDVDAHTTVAGVPAVVVGKPRAEQPALDMNHDLNLNDSPQSIL